MPAAGCATGLAPFQHSSLLCFANKPYPADPHPHHNPGRGEDRNGALQVAQPRPPQRGERSAAASPHHPAEMWGGGWTPPGEKKRGGERDRVCWGSSSRCPNQATALTPLQHPHTHPSVYFAAPSTAPPLPSPTLCSSASL